MTFREKSAWFMVLALLLTGGAMLFQVASLSTSLGKLASPTLPAIAGCTIMLVAATAIGHIVIASLSPKEASAPSDERDKKILDRAGHHSGYLMAAGAILSLGLYLITYDGNLLFYGILISLILSQLAEYLFQIVYYRAVS